MRAWLSAFGLLVVLLFPLVASADHEEDVLVIGGNADARDVDKIREVVTAQLATASWKLAAKPPSKKDAEALLACLPKTDNRCVPAMLDAKPLRVAYLLSAEKSVAADGTLTLVLTGKLVVPQADMFVLQNRRCGPCNDDSLEKASGALTEKLLQDLAVRRGRTLVTIETTPAGADVYFDNERVGGSNFTAKTFPGAHDIRLEKQGFITVNRTVQAEEGKTVDVSVTLRPDGSAASPRRLPRAPDDDDANRWWLAPTALVASGGILVVGGLVSIYVGQQDGPEDRYRYTHATAIGVVGGLVGLGVAGLGGWMFWKHAQGSPTVAASSTSAVVGWAGRF